MSVVEHRFGPYGGQYVPETLMPALAELEAAWVAARADPAFGAELAGLLRDYVGRPSPLYRAAPALRARRPRHPAQARGPQPHRRPQDQQRPRAGAARPADGQDPDHRRDRRRPARGGDCHRVRAAGLAVHRLHGHRGHAPPAPERGADAPARHRGGAGRRRCADAQGGGLGGDPRLGGQRRGHALHHRLLRRPGAVSGAGARPPAGDRRRGPGPGPRRAGAGCPTASSPVSAAAPTRSGSSRRSWTTRPWR